MAERKYHLSALLCLFLLILCPDALSLNGSVMIINQSINEVVDECMKIHCGLVPEDQHVILNHNLRLAEGSPIVVIYRV
jgi:hypothetical protein